MKLEHIVGYLRYKLIVEFRYTNKKNHQGELVALNLEGGYIDNDKIPIVNLWRRFEHIKPILRPLSDLTKPIAVDGYNDGKEFVPIEEVFYLEVKDWTNIEKKDLTINTEIMDQGFNSYYYQVNDDTDVVIDFDDMELLQHYLIKLLYQWKFDIHGLIESGEAIDINTIKGE